MKKNLFAFIAVLGLVGLFSACSSDDNDPTPPTPGGTQFDGFYAGDLDISLGGTPVGKFPDYIEIIKHSDERATLQLKNFKFGTISIGDIIVPDVVVTHKDGIYTLIGQADIELVVGKCKVDVNATVIDDKLDAKIDVVATTPASKDEPSTVMNILVKFEGKRTDKVLSREAQLLSFGLKDIETTSVIEGEKVTLTVQKADAEKISKAIAVVTISDKATISPALDVEQDFSEPIEYTVTAEDGVTKTVYTVTTEVSQIGKLVSFDFSTAIDNAYTSEKSSNTAFLPVSQESFIWASSDGGLEMIFIFDDLVEKFGVTHVKQDEDLNNPIFRIETQNTVGMPPIVPGLPAIPKITSGSMFLGSFALNATEPLKSTRFGIIVKDKPLVVSGTISYKSGAEYYNCPSPTPLESHIAELDLEKSDKGIISAVVYEASKDAPLDEDGNSTTHDGKETLDGTNIYTSPKVIAHSFVTFEDGSKGNFTFDIDYTKDMDPTKTYKLALILSASENGDKFSGAGGSVLKVSKLEVGFE